MPSSSYQQIAREFMDLWQKQVSAVITDKQFIQSMLEMVQSMQRPDYERQYSTNPAPNPAHATDADHELLAELAFRLTMCEKRLASLEQHAGKKPGKKSGKSAKGKKNAGGRASASRSAGSRKTRT